MSVKLSDQLHPVPAVYHVLFYGFAIFMAASGLALAIYASVAHEFSFASAVAIAVPLVIIGGLAAAAGWIMHRRWRAALDKHDAFEKQISGILDG